MSASPKQQYPMCRSCGKKIYPAELAKMEGQTWHATCLRCVECKKMLSGANWGGFVGTENIPYCKIHHQRLIQSRGNAVSFANNQGTKEISKD